MPAEAGIQVLKGIARFARDFKCYLWVADPRQVPFLCSCKEKEPKESTPRSARQLLRARGAPNRGAPVRRRGSPPDFHDCSASPSPHRALANSPGAKMQPCSLRSLVLLYIFAPRAQTRARLKAPSGAAVLGVRYGVWNNTLPELHSGGLAGFVGSVNTALPWLTYDPSACWLCAYGLM